MKASAAAAATGDKVCFVIMPIRHEGTTDYDHFRALYNELSPPIANRGYRVVRADDIQRGGAITKDILLALAQADLVVADLTDLNPNVFYELGVRHSLRGKGTVLIVDEVRTPDVPFDLGAYRVIKFRAELTGLAKLRAALDSYLDTLDRLDEAEWDNPVHDFMPELPMDALAAASGSAEGKLRKEISRLRTQLTRYAERYGVDIGTAHDESASPQAVVAAALADARARVLPGDLLNQAEEAASRGDPVELISVVGRALESNAAPLSERQLMRLAAFTTQLDLTQVTGAVFDCAVRTYPRDTSLRAAQLGFFAHAADPQLRARARTELLQEIGIGVLQNDESELPDSVDEEALGRIGMALDAFQIDDLHDDALRLTTKLIAKRPDSTRALRAHARALENVGRREEGLEWYRRAVRCSDVDGQSCTWMGSELHNRGRSVDATEAYLLGCRVDIDDADGFSQAADDLSSALIDAIGPNDAARRSLPDGVTVDTLVLLVRAGLSCRERDQQDLDRIRRACLRCDLDFGELAMAVSNDQADGQSATGRIGVWDRARLASDLYDLFKSDLTAGTLPGQP
jgi:tetratricopeptide (TPR) repeat protein